MSSDPALFHNSVWFFAGTKGCWTTFYAEDELSNDSTEPTNDFLDTDWLTQWAEHASSTSKEDLQIIWGKILAGEVKSPGKYSLRILTFVKHLTQKEAIIINEIAKYKFINIIVKDIPNSTKEFNESKLLILKELGILEGVGPVVLQSTYTSELKDKFQLIININKVKLIITANDPQKTLVLNIYNLTLLGQQILELTNIELEPNYFSNVCKYIVKQGFNVQMITKWQQLTDELILPIEFTYITE